METGKVTSKTSSLKALLLKAWSERWTDLQWGIHIKTILPRGVSGDVYNLADIIFQQALVGPGPNQLILSYLRHCLSSQLVSYAAVISRISKFNGFHKPYCVLYLLKFLETIQNGITSRTKQEESVLSGSILSMVNWLLCCYHYYTTQTLPFPDLTKKPITVLNNVMQNSFTRALLYLAKYENKDEFYSVVNKCKKIESEKTLLLTDSDLDVSQILKSIIELDTNILKKPVKKEACIDYSMQALLKVTVLLNPTIDSQAVVNNLLIIQQLKGYRNARLYMELIRASFINLNDALSESCAAFWGAFTFIKLPHIIRLLARHYISTNNYLPEQASQEIIDGFLLLMEFCPLLNHIDTQTQNNNVEGLVNEMVSMTIISEADKNKIINMRKLNSIDTRKIAMLVPQAVSTTLPSLISMTTPTLAKILNSLDTDRLHEHLVNMLSHLLSGNSYELILTFASVKGELRLFVNKLIKYNELSRQVNQNDGVAPHVKALIFDTTFVILCSIVQKYGSDVVLPDKLGNSFFEIWVRDCMKEYDSNKAMVALAKGLDPVKVETLIEYFKSGGFDWNPPLLWDEMCFAMPAVMKEIHERWRNKKYDSQDVKFMLNTINSQMCCLSICSVSWLCSYMQILQEDELLKSRNMVQQFITLMEQAVRSAQNTSAPQDFYKERCAMSVYIIRQMQYDVSSPMASTDVALLSRSIPLKDAIYKQVIPAWEAVLQKGCLTTEAVHLFKTVTSISESRLFIKFMLHEVMKLRFEDELNKAVDLLYALFYFDIHACTIALLDHLPFLLFKSDKVELVEPQSTAVAKLTAYVVCTAVRVEINNNRNKTEENGDMDVEQALEEVCPASKIMRMSGVQPGSKPLVFISTGCGSSSPQHTINDPALLKSLTKVFRAFDNVANKTGFVNSDTYFVFNVIKQIVDCGKETAKPILANLSNTLIPNLIKSVPNLFTMELILQLYDLNTMSGRKTTVRDLCLLRNLSIKS